MNIKIPAILPQSDNSSTREEFQPLLPVFHKQFRVSSLSVARIEGAGGMEYVAELILNGNTHAEISTQLGIARSDLSAWIANQDSELYRAAMAASAEPLLDKAQAVLSGAGKTMPEVQIAKAIADLYLRRAAIRNSAYRDKAPLVRIDTSQAKPDLNFTIRVLQPLEQGKTYEHEG